MLTHFHYDHTSDLLPLCYWLEQNNVTKIFTVAALFFMPPTMISSIYGMNFDGIHELHWEYGYQFALGLMVLVSLLAYLFFRWKKWL